MQNTSILKTLSYLGTSLILLSMTCFSVSADEAIDLKVALPLSTELRITSDYQHVGSVLIIAESKVQTLDLSVNAKLGFQQRMLSPTQAIRIYDTAKATIKLDKGATEPKLNSSNNLVVVRSNKSGKQVEMASVKDTLRNDELELIQNPADPLTLQTILSKSKVKAGDKWTPDPIALARLLGVNEIKESDVKLTLKSFNKKSARIFIAGSLEADVDDVSTQMDVSGIAIIDRLTNVPTSFKIGIRETKDPGQIAPGFEGTTKIDLRFSTAKPSTMLSNAALARHSNGKKIRQRLKWVSEMGQFKMLYDPRWKMITEDQDAALLRYIDGKEILTQCQAVILPNRPADKPLTLDAYKTEISKIVDTDKNAQLVTSSTKRSAAGDTIMSVVVSGVEDGLPIRWFYYNVAQKDGRQVAFVFTLDGALSSRVTPIADQLVNEFEFKEIKKVAKTNSSKKATSRK